MQRTPEETEEILSTLMLSRWQGLTQSQALALISSKSFSHSQALEKAAKVDEALNVIIHY